MISYLYNEKHRLILGLRITIYFATKGKLHWHCQLFATNGFFFFKKIHSVLVCRRGLVKFMDFIRLKLTYERKLFIFIYISRNKKLQDVINYCKQKKNDINGRRLKQQPSKEKYKNANFLLIGFHRKLILHNLILFL